MTQDNNKIQDNSQSLQVAVSGSITVSNGCQPTQKQIHSNSKWFSEEYYLIKDDGDRLVITKCYLKIPKDARKFKKNNSLTLIIDMPNGKFEFDEDESTEDALVIYYR